MTQQKKKRKFLLVLPLLALPFICIFYFALKGNNKNSTNKVTESSSLFNVKMPVANLQQKEKNKLEIYMEAKKDSIERLKTLKKDPYENNSYNPAPPEAFMPPSSPDFKAKSKSVKISSSFGLDPNERKVNERLDKLYKELNKPSDPEEKGFLAPEQSGNYSQEISQLEKMVQSLSDTGTASDPEMKQLETLLDKLLDVQHPDRVKERNEKQTASNKKTVFDLTTKPSNEVGQLYSDSTEPSLLIQDNGFYGLQEDISFTSEKDNTTILAVAHEDQTIHDGSTIRFRLLQDVFVGSNYIPKGNFISGKCGLSGERVNVQLKEITYKNIIYPISLTVYDIDGLTGINVPGAISRDVAKTGFDQAIQGMDIFNANPSIAAQAAATGVQTAKSLLSKKIKRVQVTIKAGHKVLLKITTSK